MSAADPTWFHLLGGDGGSIYDYGSALIPDLTFIGLFIQAWRHLRKHTCHVGRCMRLGHHPYEMNGATYLLCRKHHPGAEKITRQDVHDHWYRYPG